MAHVSQLNFEAEAGPMPDMPWIQEVDDGGVDNTGEMASVSDPVDPNKELEQSSPIKGQNLAITVFTDDLITYASLQSSFYWRQNNP